MSLADISTSKWQALSIFEQLGNIGSEVGRTLNAQRQQKVDRSEAAFERALSLFDLTATDPRWSLGRRKEILRAREVFCDVVSRHTPDQDLEDYFMYFALLARSNK